MAAIPPVCDFGWKAPDFTLKDVSGKMVSLSDVRGPNGTLVMFICNHCPYVKAIIPKMIRDANDLAELGIGVVAINANDSVTYPDDSFENMQKAAAEHGFPSRTSTTKARRSPAPMTPSARQISSASTLMMACNTAAALMNHALNQRPKTCRVTFTTP